MGSLSPVRALSRGVSGPLPEVARRGAPRGGCQAMKSAAGDLHVRRTAGIQASGYLRIAIPSWRSVGDAPVTAHETPPLSREELQALFCGELNVAARPKAAFTAREAQERRLARRLREALYPAHPELRH